MINEKMLSLGEKRSVIRELFEYGKQREAELGKDSVFDFSIGNPSIPCPKEVIDEIHKLIDCVPPQELHGYTSAQGTAETRQVVADDLNRRFGANYNKDSVYMTCGASAGLTISLKALTCENDEVIIIAPYFPEYKVFISTAGAKCVEIPYLNDFQIDVDALKRAVTPHTKAVIVNSPNNPSGVVYTESVIKNLSAVLTAFEKEYSHPIYVIADEPYRELSYDGVTPVFIPNYYKDTIVCYSFSKSLSLPGERIGYLAVSPDVADNDAVIHAIFGAGRALGYVCAPALFQKVVAACINARPNLIEYDDNRKLLYEMLTDIGYECVFPNGAFYLFIKSLIPDAKAFSDKAKDFGLLLVPGDDFAAPSYLRVAYCVSRETIVKSKQAFIKLYEFYKN